MRPSRNNLRTRRDGFSLVELLVATSVATMLMLVMAGVSAQVSKLLTVGVSQNQNRSNARVAMSFMAREMRQAAYSRYKGYPVGSSTPTKSVLHFIINPPTATLSTAYKNPDAVFWQAPIATSIAKGDMAEVGYFVYRQRINNIYHSDLCRFFANPNDLKPDDSGGAPLHVIYTSPDQWMATDFVKSFIPNRGNDYRGLFLENVIGLWVQPYNLRGLPMSSAGQTFDSRTDDKLPPMVQVSMVVMSSNSIRRLQDNINAAGYQTADECFAGITNPAVRPGTELVYFNVTLDNASQ